MQHILHFSQAVKKSIISFLNILHSAPSLIEDCSLCKYPIASCRCHEYKEEGERLLDQSALGSLAVEN